MDESEKHLVEGSKADTEAHGRVHVMTATHGALKETRLEQKHQVLGEGRLQGKPQYSSTAR